MRVPPAGLIALDRAALLDAVAERLGVEPPADDAAWALVEEIARFSEAIAARLDRVPAELLQATVSMLGVALEPAVPALAVVVAVPKAEGALQAREEVDATVFLAPRNEARGPVVFVPCERRVNLVTGGFSGWLENTDGELFAADKRPSGVSAQRPPLVRSTTFDGERVRYRLDTSDPAPVKQAIAGLARRKVGWIRLEIGADAGGMWLLATINPNAALRRVDEIAHSYAVADWGRLDGLEWRPPVRLNPALRPAQRGLMTIGLAADDRTLEIHDVPPGVLTTALLERLARSAPEALVDALWRTLQRQSLSLPGAASSARRELAGAGAGSWVEAALRAARWPPVPEPSFTAVAIRPGRTGAAVDTVRVAFAFDGPREDTPVVRYFTRTGEVFLPLDAAASTLAWRLPVPSPDGGHCDLFAWDVAVAVSADELIAVISGPPPVAAWLNALLAINAPRVREGLRQTVRDLQGAEIQLRGRDIVSLAVLARLRDRALRGAWIPALEVGAFPISRFAVAEAAPVRDGLGVRWDEVAGRVTLPGVGAGPGERSFQPGQVVELSWYRRTDGALGAFAPGAVSAFEQLAVERTVLARAFQPYATVGGRGAEGAITAQLRALRPPALAPVLPTEVEADLLVALGTSAEGWRARVWTACEANLGEAWRWQELAPVGSGPELPPEVLIAPSRLRVALGPPDRVLSAPELRDARLRLESWFQDLTRRAPMLRELELRALRHLRLVPIRPLAETPALPLAALDGLSPLDRLLDPTGAERAPAPRGVLGDALIVEVTPPVSRDPWRGEDLEIWLGTVLVRDGGRWRVRVWTPEERARRGPVPWASLVQTRAAEVKSPFQDQDWVARAAAPEADRLLVALCCEDRALSPDMLEAMRPVVDRWAAWVGLRGGPSAAPVLLPLRALRSYLLPDGRTALLDPWGEERVATDRALLDAVPAHADPSDTLIRPAEVVRLAGSLEGALRGAGWPWRAQIWLPGDRERLNLVMWGSLDPAPQRSPGRPPAPPSVPAAAGDAWMALGPADGDFSARADAGATAFAQGWWREAVAGLSGVTRLRTLPLYALQLQASDPANAPAHLPSPWMARLGSQDRLVDTGGQARLPRPGCALIDATITSFAQVEASDGV